ncbi:DNA-directed DNA polymerase B (plasmid) [Gloeothece citriformis PCC 7424]|uniref:DNA-directed DNA polymerase n=1 Tax=Gloeothece citriformis (strain PCC 7424) TaxID=65393 RepID=B7KMQ6_GLOC7|nr:3'-5' exonuclease [Gloeothece citriformis]ACK74078.1 DNA-directed DNA polymerase B [Gloeothece citriformis PCC 7424]
MLFKPNEKRNSILKTFESIIIDESQLDLKSEWLRMIPDYNPPYSITPYGEARSLTVDIETLGLNSISDRILAIGVMESDGKSHLFIDSDERIILVNFLSFLQNYQPEMLFGYNQITFDLPFIKQRAELYGLNTPYRIENYTRRIATAQVFGKPIEFKPINYRGVGVIDLYHQTLSWDFVNRKLNRYDLETVALEMKLRDSPRLELSYHQIVDNWKNGNIEAIAQYLTYDLEDTLNIANYLIPAIYYQQLFLPLSVQELSILGNGKKWEFILEKLYPTVPLPEPDCKLNFDGGMTWAEAGLYNNVAKIDVSSLYPSLMLRYGITSRKDTDYKMLGVLRYLTRERLRLKDLAKTGDEMANQQQGALKILINSAFGFLGTAGCAYNDFEGAALITAYGRGILKLMMEVAKTERATIATCDTDGLILEHSNPQHIYECISKALPTGINIELEWVADGCYVPGKDGEGLRKNYLVFKNGQCIIKKGQYRKRDRTILEREFPIDYLLNYLQSPEDAERFYKSLKSQLLKGEYEIDKLLIRRKIRKNEKALLHLGNTDEEVTYWEQDDGTKGNTRPYNRYYYTNLVEEMKQKILKDIQPFQSTSVQLSLF